MYLLKFGHFDKTRLRAWPGDKSAVLSSLCVVDNFFASHVIVREAFS